MHSRPSLNLQQVMGNEGAHLTGRVRVLQADAPRPRGASYVLYWMTAARRTEFNPALEYAARLARQQGLALLVFEPLRLDYPHASLRLHRFVVDGMRDTASVLARRRVRYLPYLERAPGEGRGLLAALSRRAALVVADDSEVFFLPRMRLAAQAQLRVPLHVIDGQGVLPVAVHPRAFVTAFSFRAWMQKHVAQGLTLFRSGNALQWPERRAEVERGIFERWGPFDARQLEHTLAQLPLDAEVGPVAQRGGQSAARQRLRAFLQAGLGAWAEGRSIPDRDAGSRLSAWLHFGHLSVHEVVQEVFDREGVRPDLERAPRGGKREGYWRVSAAAEAFLDQLITWRELALNYVHRVPEAGRWNALPGWAKKTLLAHADDRRPHLYSRDQLEAGETTDPLWNAAQRQLRTEGYCHGTLRMLWGKKILEWAQEPRQALETMAYLMDRWSLDGRDPSSQLNYAWTLGQFDRPWGPERPVFGFVRYMSSGALARKAATREYLARYGP